VVKGAWSMEWDGKRSGDDGNTGVRRRGVRCSWGNKNKGANRKIVTVGKRGGSYEREGRGGGGGGRLYFSSQARCTYEVSASNQEQLTEKTGISGVSAKTRRVCGKLPTLGKELLSLKGRKFYRYVIG